MISILMIEDEKDIVDYVKEYVEEAGHKFVSTDNSKVAVEKCRNQRFDLILLDMRLNGGTGIEVVERIRIPNGMNTLTPIVVVSGTIEAASLVRIAKKISGVLVKPFSPEKLQELLKKYAA